jgi:peptidoglycan/xylan/chitin deacetylase (PgdA/CDA1 family)
MPGLCSIVTYHYVRELAETRFPAIHGLTTSKFKEQIAYMRKYYEFVTIDDVIGACHEDRHLPRNAALLTFDDGYSDHYLNVFPVLDAAGIQGVFFPPVCAIRDGRVLDVNKIHFVLASVPSIGVLLSDVFCEIDLLRADGYSIPANDELYERLAENSRFDSADVIVVKRLLQRELPQPVRAVVVDKLFRRYVTECELAFARELYMSEDQLRTMIRHGMAVGSHGSVHCWLTDLDAGGQRSEISDSVAFLRDLGVSDTRWAICYGCDPKPCFKNIHPVLTGPPIVSC